MKGLLSMADDVGILSPHSFFLVEMLALSQACKSHTWNSCANDVVLNAQHRPQNNQLDAFYPRQSSRTRQSSRVLNLDS